MTLVSEHMGRNAMNREELYKASSRRVAKVINHSRRVKAYRILCPLLAIAAIGFYFMSSDVKYYFGNNEVDVETVEFTGKYLTMHNPKMRGEDKKSGSYNFTADYAKQLITNLYVVELHKIRGTLNHPEQGEIYLTADDGVYNTKTEHLHLKKNIRITTKTGMTALLQEAYIQMKSQVITSRKPVMIKNSEGTIRSARMHINTKTGDILFEKRVKVRLLPASKQARNAQQAPVKGAALNHTAQHIAAP